MFALERLWVCNVKIFLAVRLLSGSEILLTSRNSRVYVWRAKCGEPSTGFETEFGELILVKDQLSLHISLLSLNNHVLLAQLRDS